MIKAQTAVTGGEKGGREEGREEEERFLERRGRQDMQKEKEEGETQGWLVPSRGFVLTGGSVHASVKQRGDKTLADHFLMYSHWRRARTERHVDLCTDKHKPTWWLTFMHTARANADVQLHAHLEFSLQFGYR